jgi:hydrophobic/amphiphilic exporter-1 (mainly G- bacteria), HAE1 family
MDEDGAKPHERRSSEETHGLGLKLARFSIDHPVSIWMVFISMVLLGLVSMGKIPLVMTPDISFPFVEVWIPYPNATPAQVLEAIIKPVEEALATVPHVERMNSRAAPDGASINLRFDWATDVDWARSEVRDKIEQIRADLPTDVDKIHVRNFSTDDIPMMEAAISSDRDLRNAYDFLDSKIKKPLERVPGVAEVDLWGTQRREVDIYLRLDDIKRYRVDVGSLFRRLDSANLNLSVGRVIDHDRRYGAVVHGAMSSLEQIQNFPVNAQGIKLHQVADIYFDQPLRTNGRHLNGRFAVGFAVRKTSQANTVETVEDVMAKVEEINRDPALKGIQLLVWHDSGREIKKALYGLLEAGTIGALLAVVILYLFLRKLSATLAIGFAIPFSMIVTIGFLYIFGKTLNVLSMMGLMLACGMLVDNAVVVLESIFQNLEKGRDRISAAIIGTKEVVTAVFAATLTSIIIFVPLVFGKKTNLSIWLADCGTSIIIALACSLFISLTLIPLGAAKLFRFGFKPAADKPAMKTRIIERYVRVMNWCTHRPVFVGLFVVPIVVGGSFFQMKKIPDNSPEAEEFRTQCVQYDFTENYHYVKIERDYVNPVEKYLLANKEKFKIKHVFTWFSNNSAHTDVHFDRERMKFEEMKDIKKAIGKGLPVIPGAEIQSGKEQGGEARNFVGVNLYGEDPETLLALGREAKLRLRQSKDVGEIYDDLRRGTHEVQVRVNRDLAKKYGISTESLGGILSIVIRGREIRGYRTSDGEVEIWMKLQASDRSNLQDLKGIVVGNGPDGREIQLANVAELRLVKSPTAIQREDRQTYIGMWVNYTGQKKEDGKKMVEQVMKTITYPPGYGWSFGFWTKREQQQDNEFLFNLLFALFMVYFVMASLFESFAHPFAIIMSLPFAFVGVVWTLFLTKTPFNLMAQIGLMVLVGVVVNNGIVLLDHVNNLRRTGLPRYQAITEGCRERFRPILMTACTTIVGLVPLAVGSSGVFELRYFPLARTVMGGLAASTLLTLLVLPTYYVLFDDLAQWLKRIWIASTTVGGDTEAAAQPAVGD